MDATLELLARVLVGLFAAGVVFVLYILGTHAKADHRSWRQIKAGPMYWIGLGSVAL